MSTLATAVRAVRTRRPHDVYPVAVLILAAVALAVLPPLAGASVGLVNVFNILQIVADYGLVALALGVTMIIGEYDISTAGAYTVGGVVAVTLGLGSPWLGIAAAVVVGLASGAIQGAAVAGFRMSAVPVTLGGYLTLVGLAHVVAGDRTVPYDDIDVGLALDDPIAGVFSARSLIVLALFAAVGLLLRFSTLGARVRAVGGDRRSSRTAGVAIGAVTVGVLTFSGAVSALGGGLAAYSLASANPNTGVAPLIYATIAVLLGGVALAGGRGSAWGVLAGVAAYSTLRETLAILGSPDWLVNLVTGGLLVLVTVATAPNLLRLIVTFRSRARARAVPPPSTDSGEIR